MKLKKLLPAFLMSFMLVGCTQSLVYTPTQGGVEDTLHNEVHVASLEELEKGGFKYEKDEKKVYFTDDDGLKYKWNGSSYVCITETDTTINFYFDNTQTSIMTSDGNGNAVVQDTPIFTLHWYMMKPLGEIPEAVNDVSKIIALGAEHGFAPTDMFPTFIGFSFYSTCLDETGLWNYKTDHKQQAVTNLYGIWVNE